MTKFPAFGTASSHSDYARHDDFDPGLQKLGPSSYLVLNFRKFQDLQRILLGEQMPRICVIRSHINQLPAVVNIEVKMPEKGGFTEIILTTGTWPTHTSLDFSDINNIRLKA